MMRKFANMIYIIGLTNSKISGRGKPCGLRNMRKENEINWELALCRKVSERICSSVRVLHVFEILSPCHLPSILLLQPPSPSPPGVATKRPANKVLPPTLIFSLFVCFLRFLFQSCMHHLTPTAFSMFFLFYYLQFTLKHVSLNLFPKLSMFACVSTFC
jgi:hypothetical protein